MNRLRKYLYWLLATALLGAVVLYGFLKTGQEAIGFCVEGPGGAEVISLYEADGCSYVFLPSYARMDRVTVMLPGRSRVTLGGITLTNGMDCGSFQPGTEYTMDCNGLSGKVKFLTSANVAAMYVDTVSGSMKQVHQDKSNGEEATVTVYTADGQQNYADTGCVIKGRGTTSWRLDKKPYTVTLESPADILGMEASGKWVLLADAYDPSHMKNKLVYDFAGTVGRYDGWAPECSYVDLYLNGEYAGIYLLCRKIDAGELFLDLEPEDVLYELTLEKRLDGSTAAVSLGSGRALELVYPEVWTDAGKAEQEVLLLEIQEALFSGPEASGASDRQWDDCIDIDSWARKYLIEEIFSNFDAGKASQYFWWDASAERLVAGPCWDYDRSMGKMVSTTWYTPCCLLAQRDWSGSPSWYSALWQKEEFRQRVTQLYAQEFRPLLRKLVESELPRLASEIESAVEMDRARWPEYRENRSYREAAAQTAAYLREHAEFLDDIWLENRPYCAITLQTSETYNLYVPYGTVCDSLPQPEDFGLEGQWVLQGTEEPFDGAAPITGDITLVCAAAENSGLVGKSLTVKGGITLLSIGVLLALLLWAILTDIGARRKERRNEGEQSRTQVSS